MLDLYEELAKILQASPEEARPLRAPDNLVRLWQSGQSQHCLDLMFGRDSFVSPEETERAEQEMLNSLRDEAWLLAALTGGSKR